ncbi:MAG: (Fe-S)-binding protein, partial [Longimicrobiales bacterium]
SAPWAGRSRSRAATAPAGATRGLRVAMLYGCVQHALFRHVNADTAQVLVANGCEVVAAPGQRCCGALHAHGGDLETARSLARRNVDAFERAGAEVIVVNAAGCGAVMKEYGHLLEDDADYAARAGELAARVRDLFEFLAAHGARPGAPLALRAAYDAPCHLYHGQAIRSEPVDVLRAVPGLEVDWLAHAEECCGGAGVYGLTHPDLGGRILDDKVADAQESAAAVVITGNPGCIMQIGAGLLLARSPLTVAHPVELLAESYRRQVESAATRAAPS